MKKTLVVLFCALISSLALNASAEVTSLKLRFAGGCLPSNKEGSCLVRVSVNGSDLAGTQVKVKRAATLAGPFVSFSKTARFLNEKGQVSLRFKNVPACYIATLADDSKRSRAICE